MVYNCNECGQEIFFFNDKLGKNGKPRPCESDGRFHVHIKKPNVVGQKVIDEPVQNDREEYWRKRDEIFERRFALTQSHWATVENLLLAQAKELQDIATWLKANHSSKGSKEAITELNDKTHNLESIINLKDGEIANLKDALAQTSFKSGNEV